MLGGAREDAEENRRELAEEEDDKPLNLIPDGGRPRTRELASIAMSVPRCGGMQTDVRSMPREGSSTCFPQGSSADG